jgi:serine/threonine protein kinase
MPAAAPLHCYCQQIQHQGGKKVAIQVGGQAARHRGSVCIQPASRAQACHAWPSPSSLPCRDDDTTLRLSDFGLSCYVSEGEVLHDPLGTLFFMAPEVIKNNYNKEVSKGGGRGLTVLGRHAQQAPRG